MKDVQQFSSREHHLFLLLVSPLNLLLFPALGLVALILDQGQPVQAKDSILEFPGAVLPPSAPAIATPTHSGDLDFSLPMATALAEDPEAVAPPMAAQAASTLSGLRLQQDLFKGGSRSLVAKAVGSAEGTRTPDGHKTPAYYGHVDPGNRVWNLGSFSYQHGADSPEAADRKQLARLQAQAEVLHQQAQKRGLELTLEEELNGIDLANQAPQAALARGGYIDWLVEARRLGKQGSEAVTWARARSFLDPDTGRWNAPGLGNNTERIFRDQERRRLAIAWAIAAHQPVAVAGNLERLIQVNRGTQATPGNSKVAAVSHTTATPTPQESDSLKLKSTNIAPTSQREEPFTPGVTQLKPAEKQSSSRLQPGQDDLELPQHSPVPPPHEPTVEQIIQQNLSRP